MPEDRFVLTVPIDASELADVPKEEGTQEVRVLARGSDGTTQSTTVKLAAGKKAKATLEFERHPGAVRVVVGPAEASDDELLGLQTLVTDVPVRTWEEKPKLTVPPIVVTPHWWWWWLRWCRVFTVRGRVVCPDGSPVPGAEVCAFDVDNWFTYTSTQKVGCATTGIDGTFELRFRWCCGWWPWWWWRRRVWRLNELLVARVGEVLRARPDLKLARLETQPSLAAFEHLVGDESLRAARALRPADVPRLPKLREKLVARLPRAPHLEALQVWPWHPWTPWRDCSPDLIFRVTQDCETPGQVVLEETVADTRWNVEPETTVTLVVENEACCVPCPEGPCDELDCLVLDKVCTYPLDHIGGNLGAPAAPLGYANPGPVPANTTTFHRAFAGTIDIWTNPNDVAGVDFFEVEVWDDDPAVLDWVPLPAGAAVDFYRRYWDFSGSPPSVPAPFKFQDIAGHEVVESRRHFEDNHPLNWPAEPGATNAIWLSTNYSLLLPLDTTKFPDGTYRFRVVGWEAGGPDGIQNSRVLPVCGEDQDENELVLTFDNRVTNAAVGHAADHNCGAGVHLCTPEPDTHILAVRIDGEVVEPCATVGHDPGATVEIDFLATDADDHLAFYVLEASWGLSLGLNLLNRPGAVVTALTPGAQTGHAAGQSSGNYGTAVAQGAVAPHWSGGTYRLTLPLGQAFPDPCCYQLELRAYKRTAVGGSCTAYTVGLNGNRTEYSLGVGVCPPGRDPARPVGSDVPITRPVDPDIRDLSGRVLLRPPTPADPLGRGGQ